MILTGSEFFKGQPMTRLVGSFAPPWSGEALHGANMKTIAIDQAVELIPHGASLMIGGFMGVGTPSASLTRSYDRASANSP